MLADRISVIRESIEHRMGSPEDNKDQVVGVNRLEFPTGKVDVIIDSDAYNEIDDQYAIAYALKSKDKVNVKAIYAAPFSNFRAETPAEGMEQSYQEIEKLLDFLGEPEVLRYRGSRSYLLNETTPVISDAAEHLVEFSKTYTTEDPLYVIAIGAITNIASAYLMDPSIGERIVLVWLGGHAHHWTHNKEFNLYQDVSAARVIFQSDIPIIQVPCMGVVSAFTTTGPELVHHLRGKNALCDYLVDITFKESEIRSGLETWTRPIWDVAAVAWLIDESFVSSYLVPSPIPQYDNRYSFDPRRRLIRYVYHVNRDALFLDLFRKLIN